MKQNEKIEPATEVEEEQIRNENSHMKIKAKARSGKSKNIHILNNNDEKLCDTKVTSLTKKSFKVAPPGYFDFCKECLQVWRNK